MIKTTMAVIGVLLGWAHYAHSATSPQAGAAPAESAVYLVLVVAKLDQTPVGVGIYNAAFWPNVAACEAAKTALVTDLNSRLALKALRIASAQCMTQDQIAALQAKAAEADEAK